MDIIVKRRGGFTLAEVLITLSIIGVVAALTIPSLIVNNQEKQTVVQLKKAYNILSNAFSLAVVDYGDPSGWGLSDYNNGGGTTNPVGGINMVNIMGRHLNVVRNCKDQKGCFPNVMYKKLNGTNYMNYDQAASSGRLTLADGILVAMSGNSPDCSTVNGTSENLKHVCGEIHIDLNGFKGPNQAGIDLFAFHLTKSGIIPWGGPEDTAGWSSVDNCHINGYSCGAWVLLHENMDYKKGPVSWN